MSPAFHCCPICVAHCLLDRGQPTWCESQPASQLPRYPSSQPVRTLLLCRVFEGEDEEGGAAAGEGSQADGMGKGKQATLDLFLKKPPAVSQGARGRGSTLHPCPCTCQEALHQAAAAGLLDLAQPGEGACADRWCAPFRPSDPRRSLVPYGEWQAEGVHLCVSAMQHWAWRL